MPFGIENFSFDLFGMTRRTAAVERDTAEQRKSEDRDGKTAEGAERARDQENFFWGMFPVL